MQQINSKTQWVNPNGAKSSVILTKLSRDSRLCCTKNQFSKKDDARSLADLCIIVMPVSSYLRIACVGASLMGCTWLCVCVCACREQVVTSSGWLNEEWQSKGELLSMYETHGLVGAWLLLKLYWVSEHVV